MQLFQQIITESKTFIAEFLCAVDSCINCWLRQCNHHTHNLSAIDFSIIDFYNTITSLYQIIFLFSPLPPYIIALACETRSQNLVFVPDRNPRGLKEAKTREKNGTIDNLIPRPEWMIQSGDIYKDVFRCPEDVWLCPKGVCTRFNTKGCCFSNCKYPHCKPTREYAPLLNTCIKSMRRRIGNLTVAAWLARQDHACPLSPKKEPPDKGSIMVSLPIPADKRPKCLLPKQLLPLAPVNAHKDVSSRKALIQKWLPALPPTK